MTAEVEAPNQFFVSLNANQASSMVLLDLSRQMIANEKLIADPGTQEQALHDYRVAIRKTRALLGRLEKIIAEPALSRFRDNFAALMHKTGPLRDLQVCKTTLMTVNPEGELSGDSVSGQLHRYIQQQSGQEFNRLKKYFTTKKHIKMKDDWQICLQQTAAAITSSRAGEAVSMFARKAIRQAYQITIRQADKAGRRVSTSTLHKLRKQCKDLRYLLDMFSVVFRPEPRSKICRKLKKLQGRLGKIQDLQVLHLLVREYAGKFENKLDRQSSKAVKQLLKKIKADSVS